MRFLSFHYLKSMISIATVMCVGLREAELTLNGKNFPSTDIARAHELLFDFCRRFIRRIWFSYLFPSQLRTQAGKLRNSLENPL